MQMQGTSGGVAAGEVVEDTERGKEQQQIRKGSRGRSSVSA